MAYTKIGFTNGTTKVNADNMNHIEDGIYNANYELTTGWISADETWTYSSVDDPTGVITISGDKTGKYSLGMRIKFTNGGNIIYGIITKISYSSPNTTLTFLHEINPSTSKALHLMANSAITANYYSSMKVPYGFPISSNKWSVKVTVTDANRVKTSPTVNSWYGGANAWSTGDNVTISIPIGDWNVIAQLGASILLGSASYTSIYATLSANSSFNDTDMNAYCFVYSNINSTYSFNLCGSVNVATKTVYYLMLKTDVTATNIELNKSASIMIKAVCAYL